VPLVSVEKTAKLEEWRAARVDLAAEIATDMFNLFNWATPPTDGFRRDIEKLFQRRL
jgi:hypothetical protein